MAKCTKICNQHQGKCERKTGKAHTLWAASSYGMQKRPAPHEHVIELPNGTCIRHEWLGRSHTYIELLFGAKQWVRNRIPTALARVPKEALDYSIREVRDLLLRALQDGRSHEGISI